MITIQIVDDHKMVVESLSHLINESGIARVTDVYYDMQACSNGLIVNGLPDVLLLDIGFPDGDGVEYCATLKKQYPSLKIIMLTTHREFSIAKRALHNGAMGYILKNAESEEMFEGIKTVYNGEQFLCEEIDLMLKDRWNEDIVWFTNREKDVLRHIANGLTSREIADKLLRDEETIRTYRRNILIKLQAKNTPEAIKKGYEMRIIM